MIHDIYGQLGKIIKLGEEAKFRKLLSGPRRKIPGLTLYHFWGSPYCYRVRRATYEMGLEIPFKDVLLEESAHKELVQLGGKDLSPCLRIESADGVKWMYESQDIIAYLKSRK